MSNALGFTVTAATGACVALAQLAEHGLESWKAGLGLFGVSIALGLLFFGSGR